MTAERTVVFVACSKKLVRGVDRVARAKGITRAELLRRAMEKLANHRGKVPKTPKKRNAPRRTRRAYSASRRRRQ